MLDENQTLGEFRSNYSKQPKYKFSQHHEFLMSHRQPVRNVSPRAFGGSNEDRHDSLVVLDHALFLKKQKEKERQKYQDEASYRRQQEFMEHLISKRRERIGDGDSDLSSELSKNEEDCHREIEAMTQDGLILKQIHTDVNQLKRFIHTPKNGTQEPEDQHFFEDCYEGNDFIKDYMGHVDRKHDRFI